MSLLWITAGLYDDYDYSQDTPASPAPSVPKRGPSNGLREPHILTFGGEPGCASSDLLPSEYHCSQRCAWESAAKHGIPLEAAESWHHMGTEHLVVDPGKWRPRITVTLHRVYDPEKTREHRNSKNIPCDHCGGRF